MMDKTERRREKERKNIEPPRDYKLLDKMLTYEERYFKDMTLNAKEIQNLFMCYQKSDKGKWVKTTLGETPYISLGYWKITERRVRGCDGYCKSKDLEIVIKKGMSEKEQRITLLHEMIHALEDELTCTGGCNEVMREILLLYLYKKIVKRLGYKKTDTLMRAMTSSIFWYDVAGSGHSILFTLKSLDLDIRLHLPYGSIFAYGRTDYFPQVKVK